MRRDMPIGKLSRETLQRAWPAAALVTAVVLVGAWFLQSTIPRHVVLASGLKDGLYHQHSQRYKQILAREGVTVEERLTGGAEENEQLLHNPKSGVDVAFMHGGIVRPQDRGNLTMLMALYYEPLWIFYRGPATLAQLDELRGKKVAIGSPGSGVRAFVEPLLAANEVTSSNTRLSPLVNLEALHALQRGEIDAALFIGQVPFPAVWEGLHDPSLKLMSLERADAYPRRFPYITKLTLPPGTVDLARHIPAQEVKLIGTKAMLVARDDLSPLIANLLLEAARELHSEQGHFAGVGEFPNAAPVDLPVSADASRHLRFGPSFLHRYLPFFIATYLERLIVVLVPLLVLLVPMTNLLPRVFRWRVRSRIYRLYGELKLLERAIGSRTGTLPMEQWLVHLDRIEQAAARMGTPASYASEAYTLREHIALVRRTVLQKAADQEGIGNSNALLSAPDRTGRA
jgi:TRAP-type uncharacterized transport system substrate-binding protein